jgi:phosphoglycolate phosphatase
MNKKYNAVIFDFDYTLADSSTGIIECVNFALAQLGHPCADELEIKKTIGWSLAEIFKRLTNIQDPLQQDLFKKLFIEKADLVMAPKTIIFEEVPKVINVLRENKVKTAIVSTKFRYRIAQSLENYGLTDLFEVVIGGEDVERMKPHPESLILASKQLNVDVKKCLYVGDSVVDAEAAQAAGMDFCPVLSGTTRAESFEKFKKVHVLVNLNSLIRFLKL